MLKKFVGGVIVAISASALLVAVFRAGFPFQPRHVASGHPGSRTSGGRRAHELGRWGKDDEMGALNLITPEKRRAAAALVKEGLAVSLASNAATQKGHRRALPAPSGR